MRFFYNDPKEYNNLLKGRLIGNTFAYGGQIKISAINDSKFEGNNEIIKDDVIIVLSEDTIIKYVDGEEEIPKKNTNY